MTRITAMLLGILALGAVTPLAAKRSAPPVVTPLVLDGVEYSTAYEHPQESGSLTFAAYVQATNVADHKLLWRALIYRSVYVAKQETDVQDVYITSLALDRRARHRSLRIRNERRKEYLLDLQTHQVTGRVAPADCG
jgi:hypothetical protein